MSAVTIFDPLGLKQHIRGVIQKNPKNSNVNVDNDAKVIEAALPEVKVYNQKITKPFEYANFVIKPKKKLGIHVEHQIDEFDQIVFSNCDFSAVNRLNLNSINSTIIRFNHCIMPKNLDRPTYLPPLIKAQTRAEFSNT